VTSIEESVLKIAAFDSNTSSFVRAGEAGSIAVAAAVVVAVASVVVYTTF
jgi:hypothetical protein